MREEGRHVAAQLAARPRRPTSPPDVVARLAGFGYLADLATATTTYLAGALGKPLLVEGPAGVGKTELAKAVARVTGAGLGGPPRRTLSAPG